ncbi:MAG TPA: CDP-diacylglycerol--serine O-phosphatidyltransferase [Planctomycetota bacterium]|nr:CDP-diacylglycerol--serine O-phosphatidyltransferase [Planctomycetota bacterium]
MPIPAPSVALLPSLLTMANAGCGLLAISKAIDALAAGAGSQQYHDLLEASCWLVLLAMIFDALDGKVARLTDSSTPMGAELDSFADAITFGVAPAMVAKTMLEAEHMFHPRLNFLAVAMFSLLAVVRLARFNLTTEAGEEHHRFFTGLPSPAAAGTLVATILMCLSLGGGNEGSGEQATAVGRGLAFLPEEFRMRLTSFLQPVVFALLPILGLLMVSQVRYRHAAAGAANQRSGQATLVKFTVILLLLYLAPVPSLFVIGYAYVLRGLWDAWRERQSGRSDSFRKAG